MFFIRPVNRLQLKVKGLIVAQRGQKELADSEMGKGGISSLFSLFFNPSLTREPVHRIPFMVYTTALTILVLTLVESISSSSCQGGGCPCLILSSITILLILKFFATGSSVTKGCTRNTHTMYR